MGGHIGTPQRTMSSTAVPSKSHFADCRRAIVGIRVIHKRVETIGVYPLVPLPGRQGPVRFSSDNPPFTTGKQTIYGIHTLF